MNIAPQSGCSCDLYTRSTTYNIYKPMMTVKPSILLPLNPVISPLKTSQAME